MRKDRPLTVPITQFAVSEQDDATPVGMVMCDCDGRLIAINAAFSRLIGRTADALVGAPITDLFVPADRASVARRLSSLSDGEPGVKMTLTLLKSCGAECNASIYAERASLPFAPPGSVIMLADDISGRQAVEAELRESLAHHRFSVALNPQILWTANPDGSIDEVGPRWQELTGHPTESARGAGWLASLNPDDVAPTMAAWVAALESGNPVDVTYRVHTASGDWRWMRARASARFDSEGRIIRWYGTLEDVHNEKMATDALAESEERLRLAIQSSRLGIWDYDPHSGRRSWSDEFKAMLGLPADAEPTIELALSLLHPEDRRHLESIVAAVSNRAVPRQFESMIRIRRADNGEQRWLKSAGWNIRSQSGVLERLLVTFQDVTEERTAKELLRWTAMHDALTSLPNRNLLYETLDQKAEQAEETATRFGLLLCDVDDLKITNDTLGHDAGDALLRTFAERLAKLAPSGAIVGRLAGDEFAVIIPDVASRPELETIAAHLIEGLRVPFQHDGRSLDCAASIGASLFPDDGTNASELLKSADLALYSAKTSGRGRLTMFQPNMRAVSQKRASMLNMARSALNSQLIVPYYQPKVLLDSGRISGFEALLRWRHPLLGLQMPRTITAAFEDFDLAVAITETMLKAVTDDVRRWLDRGFDPGSIAINASAADFKYDDFAERVLERLAACEIPPEYLEIEITETVFLGRGAEYVERALRLLSAENVRIALDDFGTGFASLSHLKQYPVDTLKIDRSFVSNVEHDRDDAAIVDAIINLGRAMRMTVVAEGIETDGQAQYLRANGCRVGQGFLFGAPQPAEEVEQSCIGQMLDRRLGI
ncbi:GGDEF domain-containing protein [Sphingomonas sp. DBB INV C78]|uniref:sensor domain-containing protein n=1 Tax=Sphingomonas sp. DBB INV C78 TaxID=3349434 RepID=UPI0036D21D60